MPMPKDELAELIEEMIEEGLTQSEIARQLGCSRQYISRIKRESGRHAWSAREIVRENFPWKTGEVFNKHPLDEGVRAHMEYRQTGMSHWSDIKRSRLIRFYRQISIDHVVEFDPWIPPSERYVQGGFALRERLRRDEDLIIRRNEFAEVNDVAYELLRLPKEWPESFHGDDNFETTVDARHS